MNRPILLLTVLISLLLTSCVKNPGAGGDAARNKVWKMKVSSSFDWKTYSNVECKFTSPNHISMVELSLPDSSEPFAVFQVGASINTQIISIPKSLSSVLVSYLTTSETTSTPVVCEIIDDKIFFAVPQEDSKPIVAQPQPQAMTSRSKDASKPAVINYPPNGLGTLMFEDLWPIYGDFDLNDMVVNYHIQMNMANAHKIGQVHINFVVRALGGSEPYTLYLQLNTVKQDNIRDCFIMNDTKQGAAATTVTKMGSNGNPAVMRFDNVRDNKNTHSSGMITGSFVNTSRGYELPMEKLVKFDLYFDFFDPIELGELTLDDFNFFIGKEQTLGNPLVLKEIHLSDMPASEFGALTYETLSKASSHTNTSSRAYRSNEGIVWGVNIADGTGPVPHAYEDVADFLEAYPKFKSWAQTNGVLDKDWYKYPVDGKVNTVK